MCIIKREEDPVLNRFFDMENPFMQAMGTACNLLVLNLLTLVCCLPVFTAGAAFTALNDVMLHIVRQEDIGLVKPFFRSFVRNFAAGSLLWLILFSAAALLGFDYMAALAYIPTLRIGIIAIAVLLLAISLYAFALLARYDNTLRGTLKNAAVLMVSCFPRTLCMTAATIGFWVLSVWFYRIGAPLLLMFGFSLPCYICVLLMNDVFNTLEGSSPLPEDDPNTDQEEPRA